MHDFDRKSHWEKIYGTKEQEDVSWYQPIPTTSLEIIEKLNLSEDAKIIDIGGGDSLLADHLLELGYRDVTVLDISQKAIDRAMKRLGEKAERIKWIVSDVLDIQTREQYDLWHDRAAFHFLTNKEEIERYMEIANLYIQTGGSLVVGTFSEKGPEKCSGIRIKQYSEQSLAMILKPYFEKTDCFYTDHKTPFETIQNFLFCSFRKKT